MSRARIEVYQETVELLISSALPQDMPEINKREVVRCIMESDNVAHIVHNIVCAYTGKTE